MDKGIELEIDREAILQVFLAESGENLSLMEESLVALETQPDDQQLLRSILRVAHTLKGSASCLGLHTLTEFTHVLEDMLQQFASLSLRPTSNLITLLLQSVDALRQMVPETVSGVEVIQPSHAALLKELSNAVLDARLDTRDEPTTNEPGVDVNKKQEFVQLPDGKMGTLRVDVKKLDRMLTLTGEIAIARGRLRQAVESFETRGKQEILEADMEVDGLYLELQEMVLNIRMVPVGPIFRHYIRTVRDLAESHKKLARLNIEGADVEVDTRVIEQLTDPLTHMIRNAIGHGIEPAHVRRKIGKDSCGLITLRAYQDSSTIVIQLSDDGAGLDRKRILDRARSLGFVKEGEEITDSEILQLIFKPGFSTSDNVTDLSGRGIGMDIVRRNIESLRGTVELDSRQGKGTTVTIRLPLTLAIIEGLQVGVNRETYIIPMESVVECLDMPNEERHCAKGSGVFYQREQPLPYICLRDMFDLGLSAVERENIVVVQHHDRRAGILVDAVYGEGQAVIKPLGKMFRGLPGIAGSTILGNGTVALILDVPALLQQAVMH
ncbi:MAG TPA: chemotaxis protein CheA [Blastocatellia bacterium]|nr:chemotaxis protein CheA [Blastocatellia bacterium]